MSSFTVSLEVMKMICYAQINFTEEDTFEKIKEAVIKALNPYIRQDFSEVIIKDRLGEIRDFETFTQRMWTTPNFEVVLQ